MVRIQFLVLGYWLGYWLGYCRLRKNIGGATIFFQPGHRTHLRATNFIPHLIPHLSVDLGTDPDTLLSFSFLTENSVKLKLIHLNELLILILFAKIPSLLGLFSGQALNTPNLSLPQTNGSGIRLTGDHRNALGVSFHQRLLGNNEPCLQEATELVRATPQVMPSQEKLSQPSTLPSTLLW